MALRTFTKEEMLKNALANNSPDVFKEMMQILSGLWCDATSPPLSFGVRSQVQARKTTGVRRYCYPFAVPCWGASLKRTQADTGTTFSTSYSVYNRIRLMYPNSLFTGFGTSSYSSSRSASFNRSTIYSPSSVGFVFLSVESDNTTDNAQITSVYGGAGNVSIYNPSNVSPSQTGTYTGAMTSSNTDTTKQICFGIPPYTGDNPVLSGAFVENAKEFFNRLLLVPMPLWCHTCEPASVTDYTPPLTVRQQSNGSYYETSGHMRDTVIRMPHFVPYREGAPSFCNVLNIAIWETDKFRDAAYSQVSDFFLKVEIGGVEYDARVRVMGEKTYHTGITERGLLCQVPSPQGVEGSFLQGGRRFWPVRISSYGRVCKNGKGESVLYTDGIGSVSAWLGGEIAKGGF